MLCIDRIEHSLSLKLITFFFTFGGFIKHSKGTNQQCLKTFIGLLELKQTKFNENFESMKTLKTTFKDNKRLWNLGNKVSYKEIRDDSLTFA